MSMQFGREDWPKIDIWEFSTWVIFKAMKLWDEITIVEMQIEKRTKGWAWVHQYEGWEKAEEAANQGETIEVGENSSVYMCVCVKANEEKVSRRKKWSTESNATDKSNKMRNKKWPLDLSKRDLRDQLEVLHTW